MSISPGLLLCHPTGKKRAKTLPIDLLHHQSPPLGTAGRITHVDLNLQWPCEGGKGSLHYLTREARAVS